ncbi:glycolate oxidase subunit GlcE [Pelagibius litoralis]|uniref:Glycolate oxidase subunit GlcE n=1 Tax=Pelagibius litoralis TaxID=374515 RepID=A0A967C557_9PROT|nr:glycolate oxidase subunit GlcE [Pelagibius litoralis]NIA69085.1 glycolate oxidase subunit GlcE [Pelagibius litoralis]
MESSFAVENSDQLVEAVTWAAAEQQPLEVIGRGSKRALGRPVQAGHSLDLSRLTGITLYEPEELVLSARAGTSLAEIEAAVAEKNQMLAFEPVDLSPLLGGAAGGGSIGGVLACNLSGPRRIKAGAARDHFLGVESASGRGEIFKSGGRVVKNVTGYDLCKLLCGSYGTLAVMTDVTLKVLPRPQKTYTVLVLGLDDATAVKAMSRALGSPHEVSGAAHLPAGLAAGSAVSYVAEAGGAVTAIRLEGPGPSVEYRCAALRRELADLGDTEELHSRNSLALWQELRDVRPLWVQEDKGPERAVWRISVAPSEGPEVVAAIGQGEAFYDWGGGLVWLALSAEGDAGAGRIRDVLRPGGGHATLIRAPLEVRAAEPVFHPQDPAMAALSARVKDGFDPCRVLNPGRMYAGL